jgi:hypothetical protein
MRHNFEPTDSTHSADRVTLNFPLADNAPANKNAQCHYQIREQENINIIEINKKSTLQLNLSQNV